jgi:glycosyltransferase involved in cell wall biosynthesis
MRLPPGVGNEPARMQSYFAMDIMALLPAIGFYRIAKFVDAGLRTRTVTPSDAPSGQLSPRSPKVSIITVCFNSVRTIRDTIESVLSQDYHPIEYIVVDGGSTDGTVEIIRQYQDRIDTFVSEPDRGIYDAMNKGIGLATGDVVGMLNSDDFYTDPRVVSDLIAAMGRAGVDAVFADLVYVDASDLGRVRRYYDSSGWHPGRFRFGWMPAHPTLFVRRESYARCGSFSLDYRIAADFEMLVRLFHRGATTYTYVQRAVVKMRVGGVSTRGLWHSWIINREIVRACRANGIWTTLPVVLLKIPAKLLGVLFPNRRPTGTC